MSVFVDRVRLVEQGILKLDELVEELHEEVREEPQAIDLFFTQLEDASKSGQFSPDTRVLIDTELRGLAEKVGYHSRHTHSPPNSGTVASTTSGGRSNKSGDTRFGTRPSQPGSRGGGSSYDPSDPTRGGLFYDRYHLLDPLGRGGMGMVWKAQATELAHAELREHSRDGFYALKIPSSEFIEQLGADFATELMRKEASRMQELGSPTSGSTSIVRFYDFSVVPDGDLPYFVMEYLEGKDLAEEIKQNRGGVRLSAVRDIVTDFADALTFVHDAGYFHADLKPANLFVTKGERQQDRRRGKLLDFGISRRANNLTETEAMTPDYASPDMLNRDAPEISDDVYAFGLVVYELLAGRYPFPESRKAKDDASRREARRRRPPKIEGLNRRAMDALYQALAFERSERPPNIKAFTDLLFRDPKLRSRILAGTAATFAVAGLGFSGYNEFAMLRPLLAEARTTISDGQGERFLQNVLEVANNAPGVDSRVTDRATADRVRYLKNWHGYALEPGIDAILKSATYNPQLKPAVRTAALRFVNVYELERYDLNAGIAYLDRMGAYGAVLDQMPNFDLTNLKKELEEKHRQNQNQLTNDYDLALKSQQLLPSDGEINLLNTLIALKTVLPSYFEVARVSATELLAERVRRMENVSSFDEVNGLLSEAYDGVLPEEIRVATAHFEAEATVQRLSELAIASPEDLRTLASLAIELRDVLASDPGNRVVAEKLAAATSVLKELERDLQRNRWRSAEPLRETLAPLDDKRLLADPIAELNTAINSLETRIATAYGTLRNALPKNASELEDRLGKLAATYHNHPRTEIERRRLFEHTLEQARGNPRSASEWLAYSAQIASNKREYEELAETEVFVKDLLNVRKDELFARATSEIATSQDVDALGRAVVLLVGLSGSTPYDQERASTLASAAADRLEKLVAQLPPGETLELLARNQAALGRAQAVQDRVVVLTTGAQNAIARQQAQKIADRVDRVASQLATIAVDQKWLSSTKSALQALEGSNAYEQQRDQVAAAWFERLSRHVEQNSSPNTSQLVRDSRGLLSSAQLSALEEQLARSTGERRDRQEFNRARTGFEIAIANQNLDQAASDLKRLKSLGLSDPLLKQNEAGISRGETMLASAYLKRATELERNGNYNDAYNYLSIARRYNANVEGIRTITSVVEGKRALLRAIERASPSAVRTALADNAPLTGVLAERAARSFQKRIEAELTEGDYDVASDLWNSADYWLQEQGSSSYFSTVKKRIFALLNHAGIVATAKGSLSQKESDELQNYYLASVRPHLSPEDEARTSATLQAAFREGASLHPPGVNHARICKSLFPDANCPSLTKRLCERVNCTDRLRTPQGNMLINVARIDDGERAFYISTLEVTRKDFGLYCRATGRCEVIGRGNDLKPMTNVSFKDASGFADWLAKTTGLGYRLPSRDEWRTAASFVKDGDRGNKNCASGVKSNALLISNSGNPASLGVKNMIGNAQEWLDDGSAIGGDFDTPLETCKASIIRRPGPDGNERTGIRVVRDA